MYTVKRSETLPVIARKKLAVSRRIWPKPIDLRVTSRVNAGQRLMVPRSDVSVGGPDRSAGAGTRVGAIVAGLTLMAQAGEFETGEGHLEVRQGDTLPRSPASSRRRSRRSRRGTRACSAAGSGGRPVDRVQASTN
jgi:hypothetical protein